ncbi:HET-domain-containing protein [Acephala macrosclerotiorum]|nr:HET-domain-containing protein [Acephala macrosclerotiorum]
MRLLRAGLDRRPGRKIYKPLRHKRNEIRILTILPGDEDPIRCTLNHVALGSSPKYNALSYHWGHLTKDKTIFLDDQPFKVTTNLHAALKRFRHNQNDTRLWVDAICVNQDDLLERGRQVQLMRQTYMQAKETWVWLGAEADDSDRAVGLIELLSDIYDDCEARSGPRLDPRLWGPPKSWKVEDEFIALEDFLSRAWWYRVWIVQEVAVSRIVKLYCGQRSFSWYDLAGACIFLRLHGDEIGDIIYQHRIRTSLIRNDERTISGGFSRVISINNIRVATVKDSGLPMNARLRSMLYLLYSHRDADATDPRDKCLALVGLSQEQILMIEARAYVRTVEEVYISTVESIALRQKNGALDFLDHAGRPRERQGLPSWVPDWGFSGPRSSSLLYWEFESVELGSIAQFNACGPSNSTHTRKFRIQKHHGSLHTTGLRFDVVDGMAPNYRPSVDNTHVSVHTEEYKFGLLQPEIEHRHYPTGEDIVDVLWRTLVLDRDYSSGGPAPWKWSDLFHLLFMDSKTSWLPYGWDHQDWYLQISPFRICGRSIEDSIRMRTQAPKSVSCLTAADMETLAIIYNSLWEATCGRRLSTTEKGYLCMVPADTRRGDIIAVLFNCHVPVVLRQHGCCYEFVGTCYVHGIMQGEAVASLDNGDCITQGFDLR